MKRTTLLITLATVVLTTFSSYAQETALLSGKQYSFTETKVIPKMNKTSVRKGLMVFVAPDILTMDYSQPAGDYTHITSDSFEVSKNGKVQHFPMNNPNHRMAIFRTTLLYCLGGELDRAAELNHAGKACSVEKGKRICTLTVEKAAPRDIAQIQLLYDAQSKALISLTLTEGSGNYTFYNLTE